MAGLIHINDQIYHGGYSPLLIDININKHLFDGCIEVLLGYHKHECNELQPFFIANLLRHWKVLTGILKDEPRNKYTGNKLESHTCVYKFRVACEVSSVSTRSLQSTV